MTKREQYQAQILTLKNEAQALLDEGNESEARKKIETIKDLQNKIAMQDMLDGIDLGEVKDTIDKQLPEDKKKPTAGFIRAALKKLTGKNLTEAENALLLPSESAPTGDNGESYILPKEYQTIIVRLSRQFNSIRKDIGYIKVGALSGSVPIEDIDNIQGLIDFTDGNELPDQNDFKFRNVLYSLREKGALIPISNTLLALSDEDLLAYVAGIFVKKACITEAIMAFAALRKGKTAVAVSSYDDVNHVILTILNPAVRLNTRIITNQFGEEWLSKLKYPDGKLVIDPDKKKKGESNFEGYEISPYANNLLANTEGGKIPMYIGATTEGAKLFDLGITAFAASSHAGFTKNVTLARFIEFIDVRQFDDSDACYVYCEIDPSALVEDVTTDSGEEPAEG